MFQYLFHKKCLCVMNMNAYRSKYKHCNSSSHGPVGRVFMATGIELQKCQLDFHYLRK